MERLSWAPAPAARSPQRYSQLRCGRAHIHTLTRTHTLPAGTARDPQSRAHALPPVPHTPHPPRAALDPAPAAQAAPPTFPDSGDAGSALRVALGGSGRPDQLQQQPQREPGPSQRAGNAGSRGAEGGASGRRRCHPRSGATAESSQTEPAPERELKPVRGGGVKRLTPPPPPPPPLVSRLAKGGMQVPPSPPRPRETYTTSFWATPPAGRTRVGSEQDRLMVFCDELQVLSPLWALESLPQHHKGIGLA